MSQRASNSMAARSRRAFLSQASGGLGALALAAVQAEHGHAARDPLAAREPHHAPTAKSVIWCFMEGGPSHMDTFDPKPALEKYAGEPMPVSYGRPLTAMPGTAHKHGVGNLDSYCSSPDHRSQSPQRTVRRPRSIPGPR